MGLIAILLCNFANAENVPNWQGGADTSALVPIIIGFLIVICVVIIVFVYVFHSHSQRVHDRYDKELERLDRQLKDKQISEETYKDLKRELEKKYKWYT